MLQARAAAVVAITFVCLLAGESASGRPATSGADKGFTNGIEKTYVGDKGINNEKHHTGSEKSSSTSDEKNAGGGIERSLVGAESFSAAGRPSAVENQSADRTNKVLKAETENWRRLKAGDVIVDSDDKGDNRFVVARILISDNPVSVWRVLTNPFEFAGKISPRMKDVEILQDTAERSVMKCKMEVFPPLIPFISYTVESDYKLHEFVSFKRVAGSLKDFSGTWALTPREDGQATEVTYSMHVDPGLPVPQWIIRKAMRMELPRTLIALRERIINSGATTAGAEPLKSILAVGPIDTTIRQEKLVVPVLYAPHRSAVKAKPNKPKQVSLRYDVFNN